MLCACSGEQFQFEDVPQSPESLATRDFSVSAISSRTAGRESKFDDTQVDDVESTLKETSSLNYEEARALLGRLEYQRGNFDAALQVFQGIDVCGLKPVMTKAIVERTRAKKIQHKGEVLQVNAMSLHSVSLLTEAILLKSKSLEKLALYKEAAVECTAILDIIEVAWPGGVPQGVAHECKLQEMFHQALELLPKLWKQAGVLEKAVCSYRKALTKPWNLDNQRVAALQKDLAIVLLYGGLESSAPSQLQQMLQFDMPMSNLEEAILLLMILLRKVVSRQILWDSEIVEHLEFALSTSGQCGSLAAEIELLFPGTFNRCERWYLLALCYSAAGEDDVALNLLRKVFIRSGENCQRSLLRSLIFAAKLSAQNQKHARDGTKYCRRALVLAKQKDKHLMGIIYHLLGACYCYCLGSSVSDSERLNLQKSSLEALRNAAELETCEPEIVFSLALANAMQQNLKSALECAIKYCEIVAGSSLKGWRLLALIVSAEQNHKEAESIIDLALEETGTKDQLELFRLKAILQNLQDDPKSSIATYTNLLATLQLYREHKRSLNSELEVNRDLEVEAWLDLANIYIDLGLLTDSEVCLNKAKLFGDFSARSWHTTAKLFEAQALHNKALQAFFVSLSIEPDHVPSMVSTAAVLMKLGGESLLPIARSFLMNALRLEPTNHEAWLNLGLLSKSEGLLVQAADCFQAACELKQLSPAQDIT